MLDDLRAAVSRFATRGPLLIHAQFLLRTLGYTSNRTCNEVDLVEFIDDLNDSSPLTTKQERLLQDHCKTVGHVLQFSDDEIKKQAILFQRPWVDHDRVSSFVFLAMELISSGYSRSFFTDITRVVNRRYAMPVIVIYRYGSCLTIAVVHRRVHKRRVDDDVLERVTLIKDIRINNTHRAHLEILKDLSLESMMNIGVNRFDQLHSMWEGVLDIEKLNKKFYNDLYQWFDVATKTCIFPKDGCGPDSIKRQIIRLITRVLFAWFLKEKGLIPECIFDESFAEQVLVEHSPENSNYYCAVLQNLFFGTLNGDISKRRYADCLGDELNASCLQHKTLLSEPNLVLRTFRCVPFVNGGLFDCLDTIDQKSRKVTLIDGYLGKLGGGGLRVPSRIFFDLKEGLFPLLKSYKFTVEENTPIDQEVALDPELLGRVFENLLAEYNPETRDTARRSTGSFYTPRHVVEYMVDEALVELLTTRVCPIDQHSRRWRDRIRRVLDYENNLADTSHLFNAKEALDIVKTISELKILDPAVGSGAFPMSILHKLTLVLRRLDPDNVLWHRLQKQIARRKIDAAFDLVDHGERAETLVDINRTFESYRNSDFGRKLYLIQNGIFGVDVQPIACQIARLRFFISLIVEQEVSGDAKNNYGIRPLPNLETNFVTANFLFDLHGQNQEALSNDSLLILLAQLRQTRERHFNAVTRDEKIQIRRSDHKIRALITRELQQIGLSHGEASTVSQWNPYNQNHGAKWFHGEWMFGVSSGFDIVIGNPPYIRGERISDKQDLARAYGNFFESTADIYTYFYHRSASCVNEDGVICFITSNKFMRASYGHNLRAFMKQHVPPIAVLDLGMSGTFDATVRPAVVLASRSAKRNPVRIGLARGRSVVRDMKSLGGSRCFDLPLEYLSDSKWILATTEALKLHRKIRQSGIPLGQYGQVARFGGSLSGIKTGLNDAFIIDSDRRNELIRLDSNCADIIKPWLLGKDVNRWWIAGSDRYAIVIPSSSNRIWPWSAEESIDKASAIFRDKFPSVFEHLAQFESRLMKRQDRGRFFWELRSCGYLGVFGRPKIIYSEIGSAMDACIDRDGYFLGNSCYMLPAAEPYLLAILNSKVLDFYFRLTLSSLDDPLAGGHMRFLRIDMQSVPIPHVASATGERLGDLVRQIAALVKAGRISEVVIPEAELNSIVCSLYHLSGEEIALLDGVLSG